jgi:hypothetical protein
VHESLPQAGCCQRTRSVLVVFRRHYVTQDVLGAEIQGLEAPGYRQLSLRDREVRRTQKPPCEWLDSVPETGTLCRVGELLSIRLATCSPLVPEVGLRAIIRRRGCSAGRGRSILQIEPECQRSVSKPGEDRTREQDQDEDQP